MGDYYTPYKGWIRYGLDIEKFGNSGAQWLACDGAAGEWAVGFHGIRRDVMEVLKCIAFEGFKVFQGKHLMDNVESCRLMKPIQYNKHYYIEVVLQCRIQPKNIRVPECAKNEYYIANDPKHVRPYGLVVHFLTEAEAKSILDDNNYDLDPAIPFVAQGANAPGTINGSR